MFILKKKINIIICVLVVFLLLFIFSKIFFFENNDFMLSEVSLIYNDKTVVTDNIEYKDFSIKQLSNGNIWEFHIFEDNKYKKSI